MRARLSGPPDTASAACGKGARSAKSRRDSGGEMGNVLMSAEASLRLPLQKHKPGGPPRNLVVAGDGGAVQHSLGAAILRPAGDIVANRDRALLAEGYGLDSACADAVAREVAPHRHGPLRTEREVVFARAALIGVAFDRDPILRILAEPIGLIGEDPLGLAGQGRAVHLEAHHVADIDGEIPLRAWGCRPLSAEAILFWLRLARTRRHHDRQCDDARDFAGAPKQRTRTHELVTPTRRILRKS